jgi:hypothetical protein
MFFFLVMMSNTDLIQRYVQSPMMEMIIGMLEYDPDYPNTKGEFKNMLKRSKFIEVN